MKGVVKGIVAGLIIVAIGVAVLVTGLGLNDWKWSGSIEFETQTYECEQEISALDIKVSVGSLRTEFYEGERITVEYPTADGFTTSVSETDGKLSFDGPDKKWYVVSIGTLDIPETVIKIPDGSSPDVRFELAAGSATLADGVYGGVTVDIDAGAFEAGNVTATNLKVTVDAGKFEINTVSAQTLVCEVDMGSVTLRKVDCPSSTIDVDMGTVNATFAGAKEDYTIAASVNLGQCNVSAQTGTAGKRITVTVDMGTANINFGN